MAGVLFDTSVYINALRRRDTSVFSQTRVAAVESASEKGGLKRSENKPLYLSAVVLEELYVGALDRRMKKLLAKFENGFEQISRLLVPNRSDWTTGGQILSLIGQKHGFEAVGRARMTNDCLIAMTAARCGLTVITHNAGDFKLIAEFRPFQWTKIKL